MYTRSEKLGFFYQAHEKGLLPDGVFKEMKNYSALWKTDEVDNIVDQYYKLAFEEEKKEKDASKAKNTPSQKELSEYEKAKRAHKALSRTLKIQVLKEEKLMACNYTCICCGEQYPTKSEWREEHPNEPYPLFVRLVFPVIKYITIHKLFDPRALAQDEKLHDLDCYIAMCNKCQPMRFK